MISSAIGNARPFNLQQKYLDYCPRILEHPSVTFEDRKVVAEIQLYHATLRLQADTQQMQLPELEYEELERWKLSWAPLLSMPFLAPSPPTALTNNKTANDQSQTLNLNLLFCQLLLHRTASASLHSDTETLAVTSLDTSRLIVSKFLQSPYPTALGSIDQIYFIVGYAALTLCDFNIIDPLIDQLQSFLMHLSPNEDHISYRFSCIISEFKRRYNERSRAAADAVIKRSSPFTSAVEQGQFIPELIDLPDAGVDAGGGFAGVEQFVPSGFLPAYSIAGGTVFQNLAVDVGLAGGVGAGS